MHTTCSPSRLDHGEDGWPRSGFGLQPVLMVFFLLVARAMAITACLINADVEIDEDLYALGTAVGNVAALVMTVTIPIAYHGASKAQSTGRAVGGFFLVVAGAGFVAAAPFLGDGAPVIVAGGGALAGIGLTAMERYH